MNQTSYRSSQDSALSTPGRQLGNRFSSRTPYLRPSQK